MKKKALLLMLVLMFISTNALSQSFIVGKMSGGQAGISIELYLVGSCGGDELVDTYTTNSEGYYYWENLDNGTYKVVPDNESYYFNPESRNFTIPRTDLYNKNFTADYACEGVGNDRFIDNNDGTVTDVCTALIWMKEQDCYNFNSRAGAFNLVGDLSEGQCGLSDGSIAGDWRIPTSDEWFGIGFEPPKESYIDDDIINWKWKNNEGPLNLLTHAGDIIPGYYHINDRANWSILLKEDEMNEDLILAEIVEVPCNPEECEPAYWVQAVRDPIIPPCETVDRFLDNNDGTVTDCRTDLVWLKDADCFGEMNWDDATGALPHFVDLVCGVTDGGGDWRLPTKEELQGIGTDPPVIWSAGSPPEEWTTPGLPFTDVIQTYYWSSTEVAPIYAWAPRMNDGLTSYVHKEAVHRVWPVRNAN